MASPRRRWRPIRAHRRRGLRVRGGRVEDTKSFYLHALPSHAPSKVKQRERGKFIL